MSIQRLASNESVALAVLGKNANALPSNTEPAKVFATRLMQLPLLAYCHLFVVAGIVGNFLTAILYLFLHVSAWRTKGNASKWAQEAAVPLRNNVAIRELFGNSPSPEEVPAQPTPPPADGAASGESKPTEVRAGEEHGSNSNTSNPTPSTPGASGASLQPPTGSPADDPASKLGTDKPPTVQPPTASSKLKKVPTERKVGGNVPLDSANPAAAHIVPPSPPANTGKIVFKPEDAALESLTAICQHFTAIMKKEGVTASDTVVKSFITALIKKASETVKYKLPDFADPSDSAAVLNTVRDNVGISTSEDFSVKEGSTAAVSMTLLMSAQRLFSKGPIIEALQHIVDIANDSRLAASFRNTSGKTDRVPRVRIVASIDKLKQLAEATKKK
jgi:hypothetical protein